VVTVHRGCRSRHTSARCVQKRTHLPKLIFSADQQAPVDSAASGFFPVWDMALLWERANEADVIVGVCYRPPNQDEEAEEIFYKQLGELS